MDGLNVMAHMLYWWEAVGEKGERKKRIQLIDDLLER